MRLTPGISLTIIAEAYINALLAQGGAVTPVPADYDGDGRTDIAIYDISSSSWQWRKSSAGDSPQSVTWGELFSDMPLRGFDHDGDGKADPTILRSENGQFTWWIRDSSNGAQHNIPFGLSSDIPAP